MLGQMRRTVRVRLRGSRRDQAGNDCGRRNGEGLHVCDYRMRECVPKECGVARRPDALRVVFGSRNDCERFERGME